MAHKLTSSLPSTSYPLKLISELYVAARQAGKSSSSVVSRAHPSNVGYSVQATVFLHRYRKFSSFVEREEQCFFWIKLPVYRKSES